MLLLQLVLLLVLALLSVLFVQLLVECRQMLARMLVKLAPIQCRCFVATCPRERCLVMCCCVDCFVRRCRLESDANPVKIDCFYMISSLCYDEYHRTIIVIFCIIRYRLVTVNLCKKTKIWHRLSINYKRMTIEATNHINHQQPVNTLKRQGTQQSTTNRSSSLGQAATMMRMTLRSGRMDARQPAAPQAIQPRGHPARQQAAQPARQPTARKPRRPEPASSETSAHNQREPSRARHPPVPPTPSEESISSEGSVSSQREQSNASVHQPMMCQTCGQQMPNPAQQPPVRIAAGTTTAKDAANDQGADQRRGRGTARRPNDAANNQGAAQHRGRGPARRPNDAANNQGAAQHRGRGPARSRSHHVIVCR